MSYFEFPHTRNYDSDLGWLIKNFKTLSDLVKTLETWKSEHEPAYKELYDKVEGLIHNLVDVISPWDSSVAYQVFTIVEYQGVNYIAVQDVPVGVMITNTEYWQPANTVTEQLNAIGVVTSETQETVEEISTTINEFTKLSLIDSKLIVNANVNHLQGICYYPLNDTFIVWSANETTGTLIEFTKDFSSILRSRQVAITAHGSGITYNRNNNTICMASAYDRSAYIFNAANFDIVETVTVPDISYTNFTHFAYDDVTNTYLGWIHDDAYTAENTGFVVLDANLNFVSFTSKNVQDYYRDVAGMTYTFQSMTFIDGVLYACSDFRKDPGTIYDNSYGNAISKLDKNYEITQTYFMSKGDFLGEIEGIAKDEKDYIYFIANSQESNAFIRGIVDGRGDGSSMQDPYVVSNVGSQTRYRYYYNSGAANSSDIGTQTDPFNSIGSLTNKIPFTGSVEIVLQSDLALTTWKNRSGNTTITGNGHKVSGIVDSMIIHFANIVIDGTLQLLDCNVDFYGCTITGAGQLKISRTFIAIGSLTLSNCTGVPVLVDGSGTVNARNVSGTGNADVLLYNNHGLIIANNVTATTSSSYGAIAGPGVSFRDKQLV